MTATKYPLYDSIGLFLNVTGCVNRCKHCYLPENIFKFKTFEEIKEIIDNYAKVLKRPSLTKSAYLYFHDEPTTHPKIISILEYMRSKEIKYASSLSTNGFGICRRKDWKEILAAFKKVGTRRLHLALFGEREYHDWFVGRNGAFDTIVETSRRGKEMGYSIVWSLFLTKDNCDDLIRIREQLKNERISVAIWGYSSRVVDKEYLLHPTSKELKKVKDLLEVPTQKDLTIKTEKEWVEMCMAKENMEPYISDREEDRKNPWLIEYEWVLYNHVFMRSDFIVGNLRTDNLRDVFSKSLCSKGSKKCDELVPLSIAQEIGNAQSDRVYYFWDLLFRWFLKVYPDPKYEVLSDKEREN